MWQRALSVGGGGGGFFNLRNLHAISTITSGTATYNIGNVTKKDYIIISLNGAPSDEYIDLNNYSTRYIRCLISIDESGNVFGLDVISPNPTSFTYSNGILGTPYSGSATYSYTLVELE